MNDFANLLFVNATVYTVDDENPHAEAVAVQGQTIVYVGSNEGVEAWRGPQTRVVDGRGRSLLPGFIDSHFHLMHGALGMGDIQLYEVGTVAELETAVHAYAQLNPDLPWLRGQGLRYNIPSIEEPLTRHHLDAIEAQRPLVLIAYDLHTAWANTAALEKAGLLHGGAPLPGGAEFIMGDDGLAAGELVEMAAFEQLLAHAPEPDDAQRRKLVRDGLAYLASLGLTSVHNMDGDAEQTAFYAALEDLGELTLRVNMPYNVLPETPLEALEEEAVPMSEQFQSEMVRAGAVKFFMDGVYESYTAVNRKAWKPGHNSHNQTLAEAIAGYTRDAAWAEFQEDKKGQIKFRMWADLVLLTDDIFAVPAEELMEVQVALTLCNGRITWQSP